MKAWLFLAGMLLEPEQKELSTSVPGIKVRR